MAAKGLEALKGLGEDVEGSDMVALPDEMGCHTKAHCAQAKEADRWLGGGGGGGHDETGDLKAGWEISVEPLVTCTVLRLLHSTTCSINTITNVPMELRSGSM